MQSLKRKSCKGASKHKLNRLPIRFCARNQIYLLAEVLDLDRASGVVLGSVLIAAGRNGIFYQRSIEFVRPGHYGLRYTLVAPMNENDSSDSDDDASSESDADKRDGDKGTDHRNAHRGTPATNDRPNTATVDDNTQRHATETNELPNQNDNAQPLVPAVIDLTTNENRVIPPPRDSAPTNAQQTGDHIRVRRSSRLSSQLSKKRAAKTLSHATPSPKRCRVRRKRSSRPMPPYKPLAADQPSEIVEFMRGEHMQLVSESIWHTVVVKPPRDCNQGFLLACVSGECASKQPINYSISPSAANVLPNFGKSEVIHNAHPSSQ